MGRLKTGAIVALALAVPGCAALQEFAALRTVAFGFDRVSGVRVAGIAIGEGMSYSNLRVADITRLAAAVTSGDVPIELVAHVSASNPAENTVPARLARLGWTFFVEQRQMLAGDVAEATVIAPGETTDVPVAVRFNLLDLAEGGARDLFDVALAIAGYGSTPRELRLELQPTIDTSLGPIRYPTPVVIRRQVG
jgi:hypothetical protein